MSFSSFTNSILSIFMYEIILYSFTNCKIFFNDSTIFHDICNMSKYISCCYLRYSQRQICANFCYKVLRVNKTTVGTYVIRCCPLIMMCIFWNLFLCTLTRRCWCPSASSVKLYIYITYIHILNFISALSASCHFSCKIPLITLLITALYEAQWTLFLARNYFWRKKLLSLITQLRSPNHLLVAMCIG